MPLPIGTYVGSITDPALGASAIVNASNADVALGSGVADTPLAGLRFALLDAGQVRLIKQAAQRYAMRFEE